MKAFAAFLVVASAGLPVVANAAEPHADASLQTAAIQPACGVPGFALETGYRFGASADVLPGETPVRSIPDMVRLGWKHDQPWGRINDELQYYVDFHRAETNGRPCHLFEADDLALVARHDATANYGSDANRPDCAWPHIASGEFVTSLTVQPPVIVEFMVMLPAGRGLWPALWLYDVHSRKNDASEIDVMESVFNAPVGQRDDRSKIYQFDHGPGAGPAVADSGGLEAHGWWQPYGPLRKEVPASDLSSHWTAFSVWWHDDTCSKYVDNKLGVTRRFKWTGPAWPNLIVNNACGSAKIDWPGPISPATFAGDNAAFRIKWIRVFKPVGAPR